MRFEVMTARVSEDERSSQASYLLETSGARGSAGSKKDGQVMGSNLPTHMGAD